MDGGSESEVRRLLGVTSQGLNSLTALPPADRIQALHDARLNLTQISCLISSLEEEVHESKRPSHPLGTKEETPKASQKTQTVAGLRREYDQLRLLLRNASDENNHDLLFAQEELGSPPDTQGLLAETDPLDRSDRYLLGTQRDVFQAGQAATGVCEELRAQRHTLQQDRDKLATGETLLEQSAADVLAAAHSLTLTLMVYGVIILTLLALIVIIVYVKYYAD